MYSNSIYVVSITNYLSFYISIYAIKYKDNNDNLSVNRTMWIVVPVVFYFLIWLLYSECIYLLL